MADKQTTENLGEAIVRAGYPLYRERTGYPVSVAQRNLEGKSVYAEDEILKQRSAQITACEVMDDGLILGIIEKVENKFRPVFFDIFGNIVYQTEMEKAFTSNKQAGSEFWKVASEIDAVDLTLKAVELKHNKVETELKTLENLSKAIKA